LRPSSSLQRKAFPCIHEISIAPFASTRDEGLMRFLSLAMLVLSACTQTPAGQPPSAPLIDATRVVPRLAVDMRYAGAENFVGRRIAGYGAPICMLTREAAAALSLAQGRLAPFGLGLKVFDCYRPARAVADFAGWARDPAAQERKRDYYPNVDKSRLFELGYIAERSGHSRGSTLDVTIIDLATAAELDMGGGYDLFDPRSWPSDQTVSASARANRALLQSVMVAAGFRPLKEEWWHFTLEDEPFPDTYFDVPVWR
jgi:D-alanyl-D-alanine dipeptidase